MSPVSGALLHPTLRYAPLHPGNNVPITIGIRAQFHPPQGISRLELFVHEYEVPSVGRTAVQARRRPGASRWGLEKKWDYAPPTHFVSEKHVIGGFPANSYITCTARVTTTSGETADESWSFAAGDWPFPEWPIPIWQSGDPAQRIDIAFVADNRSYATGRDMLPALDHLIFDGYHSNSAVAFGRKYWQFWYCPDAGHMLSRDELAALSQVDQQNYVPELPIAVANATFLNAVGVLHTDPRSDWSNRGKAFFSSEAQHWGTALHETAHCVFQLADEYDGGLFVTTWPHHNVHLGQTFCEQYNTHEGFDPADCQFIAQRQTSGGQIISYYRSERKEDRCVMFSDGDAHVPEFGHTCTRRIIWYYDQLDQMTRSGHDRPLRPRLIIQQAVPDVVEIFRIEEFLRIALVANDAGYTIVRRDRVRGLPPRPIDLAGPVIVTARDRSGEVVTRTSILNPRESHVCDMRHISPFALPRGDVTLLLPTPELISAIDLEVTGGPNSPLKQSFTL